MKTNQKSIMKLLVFLFIVSTTFSCEKAVNSTKPTNTISVKKAKELSANFNARYDTVSKLIGKKDNRSSWYSLEELEQYIAYIKKEGKEKGLNIDGIRIYSGAYGSKEVGRENYSTVFLVPTIKNVNKKSNVKGFAPFVEKSEDTQEISPLNFGLAGNPPSKSY